MNMHMIYCNTIPLVEKSLNSMSRLILITANAMMQIVINAHKQKSLKRNGFFSNMMTIQQLIIIDVHSHILNSNFVLSCIFITKLSHKPFHMLYIYQPNKSQKPSTAPEKKLP